jgi:hypothetical protein
VNIEGGGVRARDGNWIDVDVTFNGDKEWVEQTLTIALPSSKLKIKAGIATPGVRR